ncbi:MAG TPA: hypothetical protein VGR11_15695 [Solirubrobacteraceae bacterium]|nr:hypothetical protein [Solirubrobacteraceae bacterium]
MPSDIVRIARELLEALGSNTWTDGRADRLVETLGASIGRASPAESREALATLAAGMNALDPEPAGVASRVVGAMIEAGHDPQAARAAMLGALQTTLPLCASMVDEARAEVGEPDPDLDLDDDAIDEWLADQHAHALNEVAGRRPSARGAWQRLHEIWPGAIALLSVDPAARAEAGELAPVAEKIEELHEAGGWLRAMLSVLDEEPYVAIEPGTRTGIVGRMSGIVENFQLNTLLMDEFPRDEPRVSNAAVAVARGTAPQQIDETVTGVWNLYSYGALLPGGELPDPTDLAYAETWIWNEGMPADIPVLDGHRVILLGEAPAPRTWPAQRMFLKLPARLTAELLDESALDEWLATIEAAAAKVTR